MDLEQPPAVGDCIAGRFHVEEVLGRGGMGTVFRVRDERSGKKLALKRGWVRDQRRSPARGDLLEREYHTLIQLAHPRIIEVYEYGIDEHGPYYTMELLEGEDLHAAGPLAWARVCALLYDVASSLAILHARRLLHRDVSLRNVRCTPDGRAKLLDFGAMIPMGVAKDMVGTPPFVAPEVMQMQELDARADLFSLGAVGYYLLTGRHAFPARRMRELRDVWRSKPAAPTRFVPEVPPGLSALIMQLLMLDRNARPKSAAEVMERLSALADLPTQERVEVSRAYLTTPALVGRDKQLLCARREILALMRGDGGALLIEGAEGSGRSRMLDACVLEGKLLGVMVARADATDGAPGEWGVARELCQQLIAQIPAEAAEAVRLSRDVLGHVIDELASDTTVTASQPERSVLLRALRDFVLSLSRKQRLLLAIDDVDKIDEASAALLAALGNKSERHAVMVVATMEREQGPTVSASLRLLGLVGQTIQLEPLSDDEAQSLIRSIFGDVANVGFVAGRVQTLAQGNPRAIMDLAQHLVERGLARYAAGSWLLPPHFAEDDLPATLADALAERLRDLTPDASALAEVLAVTDADRLGVAELAELAGFHDHKRAFAAVDQLMAARVVAADGDGFRFAQRGFAHVVEVGIAQERLLDLHTRIADQLERRGGDALRVVDHLLSAGKSRRALQLLASLDLQLRLPPVSLLERAIAAAEADHASPRELHQLRSSLLSKASMVLAGDSFRRMFPLVLAQLERDSGLALYRELSDLPADERLRQALSRAQERYVGTPESERVFAPLDAIRELARLAGSICSFASQTADLALLDVLPSLQPLEVLSPAMGIVTQIVEASKAMIAGRALLHREISDRVLARIAQPDRGGLDEAQRRRTHMGLQHAIGMFEATLGSKDAEARIALLESDREYRVSGARLRMLLNLRRGDTEEARKCERRAEFLLLQDGNEQRYPRMTVGHELGARAEAGDILGVKSCLETLGLLAEQVPSWRGMHFYGRARFRWLQGDLEGALADAVAGHPHLRRGRHQGYVAITGIHVRILAELGRNEEAIRHAREYIEIYEQERLSGPDYSVWLGYCQALSAERQHDEAVRSADALIERFRGLGCEGLALGVVYELRARIALGMDDRAGYQRYSELCADEFHKARNPLLSARFSRLLEEGRQQDVAEVEPLNERLQSLQMVVSESEYNTVHSRIVECVDGGDRARCALTLLLQNSESAAGYLYGVRSGQAVLLAAVPDLPEDTRMTEWANEYLKTASASDEAVTSDAGSEPTHTESSLFYTDTQGRRLEALFLTAGGEQDVSVAALLLLDVDPVRRVVPSRLLMSEIARELVEHGDVSGLGRG
ncbi:MAG TPA: protein kinase [Polyangiales bacterium]|nr:protein kinase [Polyangiales bacterium]